MRSSSATASLSSFSVSLVRRTALYSSLWPMRRPSSWAFSWSMESGVGSGGGEWCDRLALHAPPTLDGNYPVASFPARGPAHAIPSPIPLLPSPGPQSRQHDPLPPREVQADADVLVGAVARGQLGGEAGAAGVDLHGEQAAGLEDLGGLADEARDARHPFLSGEQGERRLPVADARRQRRRLVVRDVRRVGDDDAGAEVACRREQ